MKLNYRKIFFTGFAFFLICAFWQAYNNIIPKILTDKFGLSQRYSGLIMGLDNVLALVLLPLFGTISDRCRFRRGRRTPFILWGTVCAAVLLLVLGFADLKQAKLIQAVDPGTSTAQQTLYDADLTIITPDGKKVALCETFTAEEFCAITQGSADYTTYVVPARQAFAGSLTRSHPQNLIFFVAVLVLLLVAMCVFRSPAVALMPDITPKPLRSRANAVINLMGAIGGMLVLALGLVFGTGKSANALMGYLPFFTIVAAIMIISLLIFLLKVNEPAWASEMQEEAARLEPPQEEAPPEGRRKLQHGERVSLLLLLLSTVLWYMGYNAVISKYSVYAGSVLDLDYNLTLIIAQAAAIAAYLPVGMAASRIGRKKCILFGVVLLCAAFAAASFLRAGSPMWLITLLFAVAGIGWASIIVNSFPMVVDLSGGGSVGRYTGYYYAASMFAQAISPYISGILMDRFGMTILFPYGAFFVLLAFLTMHGVRHGDSLPPEPKPDFPEEEP